MATTYSAELKNSIIARMLAPNNRSVPQLAKETGIPKDTLYCWRLKAREHAYDHAAQARAVSGLSSEEKFSVVLESAALNETELAEYCRSKGFYPQEVAAWRASCMQANTVLTAKAERAELRAHKQQVKALSRELRRKEKALAEAAALLVLEKKARDLFADVEDEKSP
jgi:transposase-like protein